MKKLIFCNLDLLKSNLDPADYQDLDLSDFNFERMRKKRDKFMEKHFVNMDILISTFVIEVL